MLNLWMLGADYVSRKWGDDKVDSPPVMLYFMLTFWFAVSCVIAAVLVPLHFFV